MTGAAGSEAATVAAKTQPRAIGEARAKGGKLERVQRGLGLLTLRDGLTQGSLDTL